MGSRQFHLVEAKARYPMRSGVLGVGGAHDYTADVELDGPGKF